jgi:hypothetical protein
MIRLKTVPLGTSSGRERGLALMLYLFSGRSRASYEISFTTTAANPQIIKKATSTVRATAVTLPICRRRSARTAGDDRKLKRIASVIGTTTSRAKVKETDDHRHGQENQRGRHDGSPLVGTAVVCRLRLIARNFRCSDFTLGAMLSAPLSAPSPVIQPRDVMTDRRLGLSPTPYRVTIFGLLISLNVRD